MLYIVFKAGIDFNNEELFVCALAADAIVDMTPGNKLWGLELPVFQGRDMVIQALKNSVCLLDTTHALTNPRTEITDDTAKLYAIVEAQHLPPNDHSRHCLMKNQYEASLVRSSDRWVIKHLSVDGVWFTGEPSVLFINQGLEINQHGDGHGSIRLKVNQSPYYIHSNL